MASWQGVNVLRYTALGAGLIYGVYHQSTLNTRARHAEVERDYRRKESLIEQAKAEWRKKHTPPETKSGNVGVVTDPEDSRFDLEAYLTSKVGDPAK